MRWVAVVRSLSLVVLASCTQAAREASIAQTLDGDGGLEPPGLVWVDFAASGCGPTATATSCRGPVPLTIHVGALAPRAIESYRWTFGDGSADSTDATPTHTFAAPGHFSVTLVATAAGRSAQAAKVDFVIADPLPIGSACDRDQCAAGLSCVCGDTTECAGVPGVCSVACTSVCSSGTTCVAFAAGTLDWQRSLCLTTCSGDGDCQNGGHCRELPQRAGWSKACWAGGFPVDEGRSCVGAGGAPDKTLCAGGDCVALGARGLCARSCDSTHPCPSYASCAQLGTGEHRCLAACSATRPCTEDPFLACQASDATGDLGFTVDGSAGTFCAPRRCTRKSDCGPDGDCLARGSGLFCVQSSS